MSLSSNPIFDSARATYKPAIAPHFPRAEHTRRHSHYADPVKRASARILWAARDASVTWARAVETQSWDDINAVVQRLVVFDKVYELNQDQWGKRPRLTAQEWYSETRGFSAVAYQMAARTLRDVEQLHRLASRSEVMMFCRIAMDMCATPAVDSPPPDSQRLCEMFEEATLRERLGEYDPLVRHKDELEEPCPSVSAVFVREPATGRLVLDQDAKVLDRSDCSGTGSGSSHSAAGAATSPSVDQPLPQPGRAPPDTPPLHSTAADAQVYASTEGEPSVHEPQCPIPVSK